MDYKEHNREVERVWKAYREGNPYRIPVRVGMNPRIILLDPKLNHRNISFREYTENADIMMQIQMEFQDYVRHNLIADHEMGLPENGWDVWVDMQNFYEAAWYGAEILYYEGNSPATAELLDGDRKNLLFEKGIPDAFSGGYVRALEQYEYMLSQIGKAEYRGVPVQHIGLPPYYTDGPFTVACNLRGATQFCYDIYEDPDYVERLLDYITDATIYRIKSWTRRFLETERVQNYFFADDSIQLLSADTYRSLVLPRHKRLIEALSDGETPNHIHLCGNVTRLLPIIRDELNVRSFETGFPIEHGKLVRELGEDVEVLGGPHVDILLNGTPEDVTNEVKRILEEVKPHKKFILRDANNLSPCTPPENVRAMYEAALRYGVY